MSYEVSCWLCGHLVEIDSEGMQSDHDAVSLEQIERIISGDLDRKDAVISRCAGSQEHWQALREWLQWRARGLVEVS